MSPQKCFAALFDGVIWPDMHSYCIPPLIELARQIEKAPTREAALDVFDQFRRTPASMLLSTDATMVLMEISAASSPASAASNRAR